VREVVEKGQSLHIASVFYSTIIWRFLIGDKAEATFWPLFCFLSTDNDVSDVDDDGKYATMINEASEIPGQNLSPTPAVSLATYQHSYNAL
jgi:hypothetical protein